MAKDWMIETDEIELIPLPPSPRPPLVLLAAAAAWLSSVGAGCVLGYSSPAIPSLQNSTSPLAGITESQVSWFNGLLALGALTGGILAGDKKQQQRRVLLQITRGSSLNPLISRLMPNDICPDQRGLTRPPLGMYGSLKTGHVFQPYQDCFITERYGRRSAIIIFNVPFVIGWLNIAFAYNIPQLFIARYLTGLCCGAMSLAVPVYLAEIAPPHLRGLLGSGMQLSVTVGVLLVYAVGVALPWSWLAYHCCIYSGASMLMLTFCPETPRWLISHHRQEEALQAIRFLSGTQVNPEAECQAIEVSLLQQPAGKASIKEILLPQNWKPLLLSLFLMLFQQANGNNNVIQNAVKIFKDCPDLLDPNLSSIVLAVVMVVATFIATVVVDLAGRRFLLIISGLGNFLTLAALGTYYYLSQVVDPSYHTSLSWLPLVSAAGFLIIFSIGFGPVPWLMMSELFPLRMRGLFSGIATAFNWTCVFIVTKEFEDTRQGLHDYGTYWLYSASSILAILYVYFFLPETKGKSLEEIEASFQSESHQSSSIPVRAMI
ncbi:SLC2A8 [Cordylochernes scorpioides]|uniref:SLC2A8 n=1 Tax=Cordylochernes scorpioides TaxID=51811 RepID=A0ABY6KW41_9ARAC|nr:SLC2A8 [Cordylochernes scorpioides]